MGMTTLACPSCGYTTKQAARLAKHLKEAHSLDPEVAYVQHVLGGAPKTCACGCGGKLKWKDWRHGYTSDFVRGHNARIDSCFGDPQFQAAQTEARTEAYRSGRLSVWNSGLTKEDPRILSSSIKAAETIKRKYASGELVSWQAGLTADDDERLARMASTKRKMHEKGDIQPWNLGLTKETSDALAAAGRKISAAFKRREIGKRLSREEVRERVTGAGYSILGDDGYKSRKGTAILVRHNHCGHVQERTLYSLEETDFCPGCSPKESRGQLEIAEFIRGLGVRVEVSDRNVLAPKELDVWVPDHDLAVEFNGLFWHTEQFLDKGYHSEKTRLCREKGISLLHVWEDEWRDKRPIVESMIKHRLGLAAESVGARKCELVEIDARSRKAFFERSHIDGDVAAKRAWGLFHEGELVAALSVRRPFHRKWSNRLEVARFAVALGWSVPGALSRLSKAALRFCEQSGAVGLLSYLDERLSTGAGWKPSGWRLDSISGPTFWWTDNKRRINRFRVRANTAKGMTQKQAAATAGVKKIWGCNQQAWVLNAQAYL